MLKANRSLVKTLLYKYKIYNADPVLLFGIGLAVVFLYLIASPVFLLLSDAFRVQFADETRIGAAMGTPTFYYFERVFFSRIASDIFWYPLMNTLIIALGAIICALSVGLPLGWLLAGTNLPGLKWFSTLLIIPYILPSWTFALAWMSLFRNRTMGGPSGWMESLGLAPPDWLSYGMLPILVILAMHYTPFVILLFGNALRQFDSSLEEAGRVMGASKWIRLRKIILPLMRPAIVSASILIFAKCLGDFGVAYILGVPVGFNVLATSLFRAISTSQTGMSAVLAMTIVVLGSFSVLLDMVLLRKMQRFVMIGNKGATNRREELGMWTWPAWCFAGFVFLLSALIPLLVLLLTTLMRVPGVFTLENFTLDFWIGSDLETTAMRNGILRTADFWRAAGNTMWIIGLAATGAGCLGLLTGYVVVRSPLKWLGYFLRHVTFLPYLVPGVAFAVAYLAMFTVPRGPLPALYGTSIILVLAILADQMPFASRAGIAAMMQLGKSPEEAGQMIGVPWWRRFLTIVVPIQKNALASGIFLPFISGLKGLSLVVVLAVPGSDVLTTYALRLVDYSYTQAANAVVLMICVIAFAGTLIIQRFSHVNANDSLRSG